MLYLVVDTSTSQGSVGLVKEGVLLSCVIQNITMSHSERLLPMINEVFEKSGERIENVSGLIVSQGPGSFTGLRIGLTTMAGLARGRNLKIALVPTLDYLSMNIKKEGALIGVVLKARKNEVYWGFYTMDDFIPCLEGDYGVGSSEKFLNVLYSFPPLVGGSKREGKKIILLGDGLSECVIPDPVSIAPKHLWQPQLLNLGFLGERKFKNNSLKTYKEIEPLYLRKNYYE
ncbi:MAG: tRNA (adenosine(37)-N6)-threonylcarbamoyltransferase complex dimerization subunit type 1 TsaB [Deltaproteobacteria bacterium]|nr:tRNA (adenosine(37)-N6)-threonylcarbamoyltransferase complex dimerization subunit type 1 TsaB [Deltaproteobacteria bacterium]